MNQKVVALGIGFMTHSMFALAVVLMAVNLSTGFAYSIGDLHGAARWMANTFLLLQFPLVHSVFLSARGRKLLARYNPRLSSTWFVLISALDLFLTLWLWSPENRLAHPPKSILPWLLFAASWVYLAKAVWDAGLGLQLGYLGWLAEYRNVKPVYPDLPQQGLFRHSRHPIYLGFFLVLLTAPVHGTDALHFLAIWGSYCLIGPLLKERRLLKYYAARYEEYRRKVPYIIPMPLLRLAISFVPRRFRKGSHRSA